MSKCMENAMKMMKTHSWAEFGTTVFAFLNIIGTSIASLISLSLIVQLNTIARNAEEIYEAAVCFIVLNICAMTVFGFAIMLYLGVYQKRLGFVLGYFIFGVIIDVVIVSVLGTLYYVKFSDVNIGKTARETLDDIYEPIVYNLMPVCVVYTLVLGMICRAFCLMRARRRAQDNQKLVPNCDESNVH